MLQLVYASIATTPLTDAEVDDLREQARSNNRRDEITGIMITKGDRFLQALEGPQSTVENTFLRIVVDPRHHALVLLSRRSIAKREFGDWDMRHCATLADCPENAEQFIALLERAGDNVRAAFAGLIGSGAQPDASSASSP